MRRMTVQKPLKKTDSRRLREAREEAEEPPAGCPQPRPEVRKDIARTWWPDA
ncbi:hypothetical protein [Streptomyces sp. NK08204]|uniref:hypothetical protein n=1 Tax=Streptomyces sp. NK08204 TaxID=2873260 RepID=UPI001CED5309|nr:hypothetical protein [Streptomyces sp. NK08204]